MTYRHHYEEYIEPNLQAIDIFIRSQEAITTRNICTLLSMDENELHNIIKENNICQLNKMTFFLIMKLGSSQICQLFNRELERGFPPAYTSKDVSYIYNLPITLVEHAFSEIDAMDITSPEMKNLFSYIPYPKTNKNSLRA